MVQLRGVSSKPIVTSLSAPNLTTFDFKVDWRAGAGSRVGGRDQCSSAPASQRTHGALGSADMHAVQ